MFAALQQHHVVAPLARSLLYDAEYRLRAALGFVPGGQNVLVTPVPPQDRQSDYSNWAFAHVPDDEAPAPQTPARSDSSSLAAAREAMAAAQTQRYPMGQARRLQTPPPSPSMGGFVDTGSLASPLVPFSPGFGGGVPLTPGLGGLPITPRGRLLPDFLSVTAAQLHPSTEVAAPADDSSSISPAVPPRRLH